MRSSTRRTASSSVALATLVATLGLGSAAAAQDTGVPAAPDGVGGYPVNNALRPLTMSAGLLRIDAGFGFAKFCTDTGLGTFCSDTSVALSVGAGYGITDDFEVGATVLPLQLSPDFDFGDPSIYGQYRFVTGAVEVGARADIWFPVQGPFRAQLGVPIWFRVSPLVALRTGAFLTFIDVRRVGLRVGLSAPFTAIINATESLWFGIDTGIAFALTDPGPGDTFVMPLGFQVGYAIPGATGAPLVDLIGSFGFPLFIQSGGGDAIFVDLWTVGLAARIYIDTQS